MPNKYPPLNNIARGIFGQLLKPASNANIEGYYKIEWKKSTIFRNHPSPKEVLLGGENIISIVPKSAFFSLPSKDEYNQWGIVWYIMAEMNIPEPVTDELLKQNSNVHTELSQKRRELSIASSTARMAQEKAEEPIAENVDKRLKQVTQAKGGDSYIDRISRTEDIP